MSHPTTQPQSAQIEAVVQDIHRKFKVYDTSLGDLLNLKRYKLLIPSYQRPYEWTQKEVNVLLDDLMKSHKNSKGQQPADPADRYVLLGSILLYQKSVDERHQVVDGQQRLSTMVLLYSALFHCLRELESDSTHRDLSQDLLEFSARFIKLPDERILQLNNVLAGDTADDAGTTVDAWGSLTDFAGSCIDAKGVMSRKNPDKYTGRWRDILKWVKSNLEGAGAINSFKSHLDSHVYVSITSMWHLGLALQSFIRCNTTGEST